VATGKELHNLGGHTGIITAAVFSSDGKIVATASYDRTARIWDAATGKELYKLKGHRDYVVSLVLSPDDRFVVTASSDKTVRI
jgi:WD40 repeat protein